MRRFIATIVGVGIFMGLIVAPVIFSSSDFADGQPGPVVNFEIAQGESGSAIAQHLVSAGVIQSASTFISEYNANTSARGISPGLHRIETHISTKRSIFELLDPVRIQGLIKVQEGATYASVLKSLRASGQIDFSSPLPKSLAPTIANASHSWEGQLAPAHYSFPSHTTLTQAITQMSAAFTQETAQLHLANGVTGYTDYQNLTVASLVQIEGDPKDYSKVARVIFNRLKIGMALQLNSTVQYALGTQGRITLSRKATQVISPYNTYLHTGLPPTPIAFPSVSAIAATLAPASGDWLYFITVKPGDTRFTATYSEFEQWVALFNTNVAKGLFK